MRYVIDGLRYCNQVLNGPWALVMPPGERLVQPVPPPLPGDTEVDLYAGRDQDDLVPIPLWVAVELASVYLQATAGLADQDKKTAVDPAAWNLNKLFEIGGGGSGNRGFLHPVATMVTARKWAISVWKLVHGEHRCTVEAAVKIVAMANNRTPDVVRKAWHDHAKWADAQMATIPPDGETPAT